MTTSASSSASSLRRTVGFDDRVVRRGGMKDGWFLGTRNLEEGASVRTMGSDRTVAKDQRTSDRTVHDRTLVNEIALIMDGIALIMNEIALIMGRIFAIAGCLAGFPMSIYAEHCSPFGTLCSTQ